MTTTPSKHLNTYPSTGTTGHEHGFRLLPAADWKRRCTECRFVPAGQDGKCDVCREGRHQALGANL